MEDADCIVIGAGPAGLFCAINAARGGARVLVLEKNAKPGAKLLVAGSGQCNITHDGEVSEFLTHYGTHGRFIKPALLSFRPEDLRRFFQERGLPMITAETGKVFPETRRSADVLGVLLSECRKLGITVRCSEPVTGITRSNDSFICTTPRESYRADIVAITTGGTSYPGCGTTGDGYRLADSLGQAVTPTGPALTPLIIRPFPFSVLSGISFERMHFSIFRAGKKAGDYEGDVLVTHNGLSGPGILDASRDILPGDEIRLSFASQRNALDFTADLTRRIGEKQNLQIGTILSDFHIPGRLVRILLECSGIPQDCRAAHFPAASRAILIKNCTAFPLTISELGGWPVAMVTRGGVALDGVNRKTMESISIPGLFFAGEVLDIDGDCGGYNLQAAFSTGYLAGTAIATKRA